MTARLRAWLPGLALLAGALGCQDGGPTAEITERRVASRPSIRVLPGASAAQRFSAESSEAPREASDDLDDLIDYDVPEGWVVIAPNRDRLVNLRPGGDPEAACYLSFLQGSAGGLEQNVNRWRTQFGAEPLAADAIAALPRVAMLGRDATLVEVAGTFKGMDGASARAGFGLLGLIVSEPSGSLFLKFTAPAGLVALERERFLGLARSLRLAHGHDEVSEAHEPAAEPASAPAGRLTWTAPAGWDEQPRRMMREVTFALPGGGECYVTRLTGDAGGLRANLDRWRNQVGREPLTNEEFAGLARVEMLDQSVPVLELEGSFTGMDGVTLAGQGLLGAACIRGQDSLFVKLTGPEAVVLAERANFRAFLGSLEERQ